MKSKKLIKILMKHGFVKHHQRGSHLVPFHPTKKLRTIVPIHSKEIHRKLVGDILKQTDLQVEDLH